MQLFGSNFLDIRNKNIIPLVSYGIQGNKHQYWAFKDILTNNTLAINKLTGKSNLEIELSKEDFYRSLHCEIELFMNKMTVQYSDVIKSVENSPCWSFVTLYYLSFFSTTCFFRFLRSGFVFLTSEHIKRLESIYLALYSTPIALDQGNYFFSYKGEKPNGDIIVSLTFKGDSLHKLNWIHLESTFKNFLPLCDNDEKTIYSIFISQFSAFKIDYPSNLRNKLNYNGESSILDIDNTLPFIDLLDVNTNFIKGLVNLDYKVNVPNQILSIGYLSSFLFKFNNELYREYQIRSAFGKDFSKKRELFLKDKKIVLK